MSPALKAKDLNNPRNASRQTTILLVEDNPDDVVWARHAFRRAGLVNPIQVVPTGEEAMRYLSGEGVYATRESHPFPMVVLLDLLLPGKSGFDLLKWIKADPEMKELPVILLSGVTDLSCLSKGRELGALSFMVKPLRPEQLSARFSQLKGFRIAMSADGSGQILRDTVRPRRLSQSRPQPVRG